MRLYKIALLLLLLNPLSAFANYNDGYDLYEVGDYRATYKIWLEAAEDGDMYSQYGLALLFSKGYGVLRNDDKSLDWLWKSAKQGYVRAQYTLAQVFIRKGGKYGKGNPTSFNYRVAKRYLEKAYNNEDVSQAELEEYQIKAEELYNKEEMWQYQDLKNPD